MWLPHYAKYRKPRRCSYTPRRLGLYLGGLIICYIILVDSIFKKPARSWYPILYTKEIREVFVPEWTDPPAKVAVLLGVTSRGEARAKSITETKLFKHCLPGIVRTAGYDAHTFVVYIAVDQSDGYWNSTLNLDKIKNFEAPSNIVFKPIVVIGGTFVRALNEVAKIAYQNGMEYFLRINADSELLTPRWATLGIRTLQSMEVTNVGVLGPLTYNDRPDIFTHDMTSRRHLEIFNRNYYPPVFSNWYIDDWITSIYGKHLTRRMHNFHILHHEYDDSKEMHYIPDVESEVHLKPQIISGKLSVKKWIERAQAGK